MNSKQKWPPITLVELEQDEQGNVHFDFDFGEEFEEWFKKTQGLKRWSQKRFNEWVLKNIAELFSDQGLI